MSNVRAGADRWNAEPRPMSAPSAAEIVADVAKIADLDAATAPAILAQLAAASAAVAAKLVTLPAAAHDPAPATIDRLVKVDEAATITAMSHDWLYRSDVAKPFRVKMGTEVRFSLAGIQRYIERHRGR